MAKQNGSAALPDLNYKQRPDLVNIRAKLAEMRSRLQAQSAQRQVAARKMAEAEAAVYRAEADLVTGDGKAQALTDAKATHARARAVYEDMAEHDPELLWRAIADLQQRYDELEAQAQFQALLTFAPIYLDTAQAFADKLQEVEPFLAELRKLYNYGVSNLGPTSQLPAPLNHLEGFFSQPPGYIDNAGRSQFDVYCKAIRDMATWAKQHSASLRKD